ncbi:hypothetical protein NEOLEDRAFT_1137616 [Neolentinus lepideus HHB14362 ss-1]|uniref:Uncharacterized protein n=1 Tax=Neolentinus lepideus HHB14362 ss-1 TaxID=1314782 RepID=A0A165QMH8_9AGAM|nr:hypothetical protein NEOLEDRAFT_1137616 [Neolentinus lepideus HHB14362 ss-1]
MNGKVILSFLEITPDPIVVSINSQNIPVAGTLTLGNGWILSLSEGHRIPDAQNIWGP